MPDIAVVDYGMGNLRSVAKALVHVAPGRAIEVTGDPAVIRERARVVLPGQSAMPDTMAAWTRADCAMSCLAPRDRPFLGICLGLQMLFEESEEGPTSCLGVFAGHVRRFREEEQSPPGSDRSSSRKRRTCPGNTARHDVGPSSLASNSICRPRHTPRNGRSARQASTTSRSPAASRPAIVSGIALCPGSTTRAALRMSAGSPVTTIRRVGRDVRERLGDRAQVAHSVVDDGDVRHQVSGIGYQVSGISNEASRNRSGFTDT